MREDWCVVPEEQHVGRLGAEDGRMRSSERLGVMRWPGHGCVDSYSVVRESASRSSDGKRHENSRPDRGVESWCT